MILGPPQAQTYNQHKPSKVPIMSAGVEAGCVCILFVSVRDLHLSVTSHKTRAEKITYLHKILPPRNFTNLNQEQLASWVFQSYQKKKPQKQTNKNGVMNLSNTTMNDTTPSPGSYIKTDTKYWVECGGTHGHHLIITDMRCGRGRKQIIESLSGFPVQHDLRA